jgi:hypothetical protein
VPRGPRPKDVSAAVWFDHQKPRAGKVPTGAQRSRALDPYHRERVESGTGWSKTVAKRRAVARRKARR